MLSPLQRLSETLIHSVTEPGGAVAVPGHPVPPNVQDMSASRRYIGNKTAPLPVEIPK
jgi:hypothetical protein